jgi:hypothetical protein
MAEPENGQGFVTPTLELDTKLFGFAYTQASLKVTTKYKCLHDIMYVKVFFSSYRICGWSVSGTHSSIPTTCLIDVSVTEKLFSFLETFDDQGGGMYQCMTRRPK